MAIDGDLYNVMGMPKNKVYKIAKQLGIVNLLTKDPFDVDIQVGPDSKNRSVEILNAYLKALGLRLVFKKTKKDFADVLKSFTCVDLHLCINKKNSIKMNI